MDIFSNLKADDKQIGFDYQVYYFLLKLLDLNQDETIEYEVKDDVAITYSSGLIEYIQLKHTVNTEKERLTELDGDLWKTLNNWSKIISTGIDLNNSKFIIITNKEIGLKNKFIGLIKKHQNKEIDYNELYTYISTLKDSSKDETIIKYINSLLNLSKMNLTIFFENFYVIESFDDLITKIKLKIQANKVKKERINDVFDSLFSQLKSEMYEMTKNKKNIVYTFETFNKNFTACFEKGRLSPFIKRVPNSLDFDIQQLLHEPEKITFIKQLIDIKDIVDVSDDDVYEYLKEMILLETNLKKMEQENELLISDKENFYTLSRKEWATKFKNMKMSIKFDDEYSDEKSILYASTLLKEMRDIRLKLNDVTLDIELSHGTLYLLSNIPKIGWLIDWEDRYKNEK